MFDEGRKVGNETSASYLKNESLVGWDDLDVASKESDYGDIIPKYTWWTKCIAGGIPACGGGRSMLLVPLILFVILVSSTQAQVVFTVNSTEDNSDAYLGNGICDTSMGRCTLRAAIEEANTKGSGVYEIILPAGNYSLNSRIAVKGEVSISGASVSTTTIDSLNDVAVFEVESSSLSVSGVNFINSGETADCIYLSPGTGGSSINVNNVTFHGYGGASIFVGSTSDDVSVTVTDTVFVGNMYTILLDGSEIRGSLVLSHNSFFANEHEGVLFTSNDSEFTGSPSQEKIISRDVVAGLSNLTTQRSIVKPGMGSVTRFAGADRFATAAVISANTFDPGVKKVFIATGENFPDALAGGPAAAFNEAPILLVRQDSIPTETSNELTRLQPEDIVVLGGPVAVSTDVETQLAAFTTGSVTRLAGADRFATAAAISADTFGIGVPNVLIATGENFPDALAGGPAATLLSGPILLVRQNSIPPATATELTRLLPEDIIVLGGPVAISADVETQLAAFTAGTVTRLEGANRFVTAAAISAATFDPGVSDVFIATGLDFPDALAGGPIAAAAQGPILLVLQNSIPSATVNELTRLAPMDITVIGGTDAISVDVQNQLVAFEVP